MKKYTYHVYAEIVPKKRNALNYNVVSFSGIVAFDTRINSQNPNFKLLQHDIIDQINKNSNATYEVSELAIKSLSYLGVEEDY